MSRIKLTKAVVEKVEASDKLSFLWDSEQVEVGLQVTPAGRAQG